MLKCASFAAAAAALLLVALIAPAAADDPAVKDVDDPGVDIILEKPGGSVAGNDRPATGVGQSFGKAAVNVCTGNTGSSSGGQVLADRLAACAPASEPDAVDATVLAREARDRIDLAAPSIELSPKPPVPAVVNMQTWMWLGGGGFTTLEGSANAGDTTVTATARPVSVVWDMGEGTKVCRGPGTPWRKGLGQDARTSCGFTYNHTSINQPEGEYKIRVVIRYSAMWECEGDCDEGSGDLGTIDSPAAITPLRVTERQAVNVR